MWGIACNLLTVGQSHSTVASKTRNCQRHLTFPKVAAVDQMLIAVSCRRSTSGLIHYVTLRDLKPSTEYYYTIGDPADPTSLCAISLCRCPL